MEFKPGDVVYVCLKKYKQLSCRWVYPPQSIDPLFINNNMIVTNSAMFLKDYLYLRCKEKDYFLPTSILIKDE